MCTLFVPVWVSMDLSVSVFPCVCVVCVCVHVDVHVVCLCRAVCIFVYVLYQRLWVVSVVLLCGVCGRLCCVCVSKYLYFCMYVVCVSIVMWCVCV